MAERVLTQRALNRSLLAGSSVEVVSSGSGGRWFRSVRSTRGSAED